MLGLDLLGGGSAAWRIRETVSVFPSGFALGVFDGGAGSWRDSFGDPRPLIRAVLKSGKCPAVRVHIFWSYQHQIVPLELLRRRVLLYERMATRFPGVKFYVSPSCEYGPGSAHSEVERRVHCIRALAPHCVPVIAPMPGAPVMQGVTLERHGKDVNMGPGQIASMDGDNAFDFDATEWLRRNRDADITFLWSLRCNLIDKIPPPPPNKRRAAPDRQHLRQLIELAELSVH